MDETSSPHPLPGLKYRTETRTRMVDVTIMGETRQVAQTYTVQVPIPPRNWDRTLRTGVMWAAVGVSGVSVVWTTASVGELLARFVAAPIGYGVATVVDVAWLACQAVEWLLRGQPERARPAKIGGFIFLAFAMGAVAVHGLVGPEAGASGVAAAMANPWVAGVGAGISAVAKGLWWIVLDFYNVPMSDEARGWMNQRREDFQAARSITSDTMDLESDRAIVRALYGDEALNLAAQISRPAQPALAAAAPVPQLAAPQNTVFAPVQPVFAPVPGHVPPAVPAAAVQGAEQAEHGQNTTAFTVPPAGHPLAGALIPVPPSGLTPAPAAPVYVNAPEQPAPPATPAAPAAPAPGPDNSMAEVVRYALNYDVGGPFDPENAEVMTRVRAIVTARIQSSHPGRTYTPESIHASVNRELRKAKMRKTA